MTDLTGPERGAYVWELWERAAAMKGLQLDAFLATLAGIAEQTRQQERWELERQEIEEGSVGWGVIQRDTGWRPDK